MRNIEVNLDSNQKKYSGTMQFSPPPGQFSSNKTIGDIPQYNQQYLDISINNSYTQDKRNPRL